MAQTVRAMFDGETLLPEQPIDLRPNTTYVVTIEREVGGSGDVDEAYPLTEISRLATDMGVTDLAACHDRYAHGRVEDESGDE